LHRRLEPVACIDDDGSWASTEASAEKPRVHAEPLDLHSVFLVARRGTEALGEPEVRLTAESPIYPERSF